VPFGFSGAVTAEEFSDQSPEQNYANTSRNLFKNAWDFFSRTKKFAELAFHPPPEIFHCTSPAPLHARATCNIYTIHDLASLRLPLATMDNKRRTYRVLKQIAHGADRIVTVSETSKRDILELLGVAPDKVINTYQAVDFPEPYLARSEDSVADYLEGALRIPPHEYLLFFGSVGPTKNVGRLIEGYFRSGVELPLILVTSLGSDSEAEFALIEAHNADAGGG